MFGHMATPDLDAVAVVFAALGHAGRLAIVHELLRAHPDGLVVSEIQERVAMPGSTLSHHLDALRHAGVIEANREGQRIRYRVRVPDLRAVAEFLSAQCCTESGARASAAPVDRRREGRTGRRV